MLRRVASESEKAEGRSEKLERYSFIPCSALRFIHAPPLSHVAFLFYPMERSGMKRSEVKREIHMVKNNVNLFQVITMKSRKIRKFYR